MNLAEPGGDLATQQRPLLILLAAVEGRDTASSKLLPRSSKPESSNSAEVGGLAGASTNCLALGISGRLFVAISHSNHQ